MFTKKKKEKQIALKAIILFLCTLCILPTWLVFVASITQERELATRGFHMVASRFSLDGFRYIISFGSQIVQSYKITIYSVVVGTCLSLFVTSMAAYVISRKDFVFKTVISVYFLFSMLMGGGMLATYIIMTNVWNMRNNLLVYVLPGAFSTMNCFVMRSFINGNIPNELIESARIDGAGEWRIYWQMILPLMTPSLAAIGFMTAVGHWNDWSTGYIYINQARKMTVQLLLMQLESNLNYLEANVSKLTPDQIELLTRTPVNSGRMAMLVTSILPMLIAYPFFQKYFIKGLTLGSMKG